MRNRLSTVLAVAALATAGTVVPAGTAHAADFPPNPTTKPGYTVDFQEEFNGTTLDTNKWLPYYLPHWTSNRENAKARYTIANGVLTERLDPDTPAWNPQYDGTVRISSIQSYNADYWHRFNYDMPNDHHEAPFNGYTTKYGYFEVRAKMSNVGGGGHQAFWLVGTDDKTSASRNPEIDMIETFFSKPTTWRIAAFGWGDPDFLASWTLHEDPVPSGTPTEEYHVYGMDWTPTKLDFYYDNQLYKTINDAPNMPMGMIMGIYTDAGSGKHNDVWPKSWSVDYVRVFKKDGGYPTFYETIKNRSTGELVHIEGRTGTAQTGAVPTTWWSAQWAREPVNGGYTRLRNRWTGEYLHAEPNDGFVRHGTVPSTYWSSQWTVEQVDGRHRIKDRQTGKHMHTEARLGKVQHSVVPSTYWSSQWTFDPAA